MQKLVYLLQVAGCPLEAEYSLHPHGPFSEDVARLTDGMVLAKLLEEWPVPSPAGTRYSYRVPEETRRLVAEFEAQPRGSVRAGQMAPFQALARELLQADLEELEIASTIVFFRRRGLGWTAATEETCRFKGLSPESPILERAGTLADRMGSGPTSPPPISPGTPSPRRTGATTRRSDHGKGWPGPIG
jgi:hypothetical protein